MVRAVVHIGTEKTGTTALQHFLSYNEGELEKQRILYLGSEKEKADHNLVLASYNLSHLDAKTAQKGIASESAMLAYRDRQWREFYKSLEGSDCETVVLSSELFQSRLTSREEVQRFRGRLLASGVDAIDIVVYLRGPAATCNSLFSTAVRCGSTLARPPYPESRNYFSTVCDHKRTLQLWSSVFGVDNIIPRIYSKVEAVPGGIFQDFCSVINADYDALKCPSVVGAQNVSLSWLAVELLRRLNSSIPATISGKSNPMRQGLVKRLERLSGPPYLMPGWLWQRYREHFRDGNEWVRKIWFPDVADLFPEDEFGWSEELREATFHSALDEYADLLSDVWRTGKNGEC